MSKRWFVHRHNQTMGPWTADTIRVALREGSVDPFDLVNAEGSPVMRELIEIDEIFSTQSVEYSEETRLRTNPQSADRGNTAHARGGMLALADPNIEKRMAANGSSSAEKKEDGSLFNKLRGRDKTQLRAPEALGEGNLRYNEAKQSLGLSANKFKDPKRYYLIDGRGRILGPKSAGEIQSLYYRGVFDNSVQIKKNQSSTAVPIARFVEAYAQAKGIGPRQPVLGAHPANEGSAFTGINKSLSQRGSQVPKKNSTRQAPLLTVVSIVCLVISAAIALHTHRSSTQRNLRSPNKTTIITKTAKDSRKSLLSVGSAQPGRATGANPLNSNAVRGPQQPVEKSPPAIDRVQPSNREVIAKAPAGTSLPIAQGQSRQTAPTPPALGRARTPKKQSLPAKAARAVQLSSPIAALTGKDGQVVTIGQLIYNPSEIARCTGKCEISMVDQTGRRITAKFFKDSYGQSLQALGDRATIVGRIMSQGTVVLITGVR